MRSRSCLLAVATILAGAGCRPPVAVGSTASSFTPLTAAATIRDLAGAQIGTVTLTNTYAGTLLTGTIGGLGLGMHGIHVHETGQCTAPFATAGGHFNPDKHKHGYKNAEGHHAGDLPNLDAPAAGQLKFELLLPGVALDHVLDADGAALVIHSAADDHTTDPSGGSGGRIACGVINRR